MGESSIVAKILITPLPPEGVIRHPDEGSTHDLPVQGVPAQGIPVGNAIGSPVVGAPVGNAVGHPPFYTEYQTQRSVRREYDPWGPMPDPCCNAYWVMFLVGLVVFPPALMCGMVGICSDRRNERIAGIVSAGAVIVWMGLLAAVFIA
ncbi:unnamed protein product [Ostreobium quekettii]|uniref:Uncharacterized protein n=1 Tax=Ostreobium quekettii TaxID=121088 RepID=A0A8S1IPJ9_9CHLO|nr:unnamed protein product [Ostreobium quekettii]|eukprot:evm.model.scf_311.3 EVM.evm.TU.scf_311.3   scf_311:69492-71837(+)